MDFRPKPEVSAHRGRVSDDGIQRGTWQEAKRKCRLNAEDIALAKRLGLNPRSLIKNIPSKNETWKATVHVWLHDIEAKRQNKARRKSSDKPDTGK